MLKICLQLGAAPPPIIKLYIAHYRVTLEKSWIMPLSAESLSHRSYRCFSKFEILQLLSLAIPYYNFPNIAKCTATNGGKIIPT